jgi:PUL domain
LFPVLDITRLLVKDEKMCTELAENVDAFLEILLDNTKFSQSVANQIMAIRCFNNQLVHAFGKKFVLANLGHILPTITGHIQKGGANLQSAVATFYLNLSVVLFEFANDDNVIANNQVIAEAILYYLTWASDVESTYRALQGLGNLLSMPNNEIVLVQVKSVDAVVTILSQLAANREKSEKLSECAREVYNIVQK